MGWVSLPDALPGRRIVLAAELDRGELALAVRRLQDAVASLSQPPPPAGPPAAAPPSSSPRALPRVAPPAGRPPPPAAQQTAAPGADDWEPAFDAQAALRERLHRAYARRPVAPVAPVAVAAPEGSSRPAKAERVAEAALQWRERGRTDGADHNGQAVDALAYVPLLPDLSAGDGHGGWLVTASRGLMNLFEVDMGASEQPLQLMHSQATDVEVDCLCVERSTRLLLAAARDTRPPGAECASVHSLAANPGVLAPRFKVAMPYQPPGRTARAGGKERPPLQVASLHPFGGPLVGCLALSRGTRVSIFSLGSGGAGGGGDWQLADRPPTAPRAGWQAHEAGVTQLHASAYSLDLYSGGADGAVARWDLKTKPRTPAAQLEGLAGRVSGLHQVSDTSLMAASGQGLLATWDLRQAQKPLALLRCPDGSVCSLAVSPEERVAAFASAAGHIYSLSLAEREPSPRVVSSRLPQPPSALAWCSRTQQLAATIGPSVAVFRRAQPGS